MKFNIIGSGRLGINLALSLIANENNQLIAICNSSLSSATAAVNLLNAGQAVARLADLPAVKLTLITTPDDQIQAVANELANSGFILPGHVVAHCSGVQRSAILKPLQDKGCLIASIHPLKAFRANHTQHDAFHGIDCVVEGDDLAVQLLSRSFTEMGAHVMPIVAAQKSTYHAAAVMATNYLVTLANCSIDLLLTAGIDELDAHQMIHRMMQSSLTNLQQTNHPAQALTGPLARGDVKTINQHLQAIKPPHIEALYRAAGLATLPLIQVDKAVLLMLEEELTNWTLD